MISDTGKVHGRYDKRLLSFTEVTDWYSPGSQPLVFEVDNFRFGCALCIEIQFPELFVEYANLGVDAVLLSTFSRDPMFAIQAQGHAACGAFWLSLSVPAQCSKAAPSGVVGPDGRWLVKAPSDGSEAIGLIDLERDTELHRIALMHARPWRTRARSGELHDAARVVDACSSSRQAF